MNERIRELAVQSGMSKLVDSWEYERFAELIVQECANWIKTTDPNSDIGIEDAQALLEHFGVKE